MPQAQHGGDLILGFPRQKWMSNVLRALINTTTSDGRYKIMRAGFLAFEPKCRRAFRNPGADPETGEALFGIDLTSAEIRWIFEGLGKYLEWEYRRKPELRRGHEKMYEHSRRMVAN